MEAKAAEEQRLMAEMEAMAEPDPEIPAPGDDEAMAKPDPEIPAPGDDEAMAEPEIPADDEAPDAKPVDSLDEFDDDW